jgi:hypothetical protein
MAHPSRSRRILRATGQWLVIVAIGLLLAEGAFRLLHHLSPIFIFPSASYNRLRPAPHAVSFGFTHNSGGFKDVEHPQEKPPGSFRILGVGDSFAYGVVPYEDNYLTLLEEQLRASRGEVEVLNVGIPRTGVPDYFSFLVNEGFDRDPDAVLLSFYIGNDFKIENWNTEEPASYLWAFFRYVFNILPAYEGPTFGAQVYQDDQPSMAAKRYAKVLRRRLAQFREENPSIERFVPEVVGYLEKIRDLCQHRGVELAVVVIPDELQVDPELRRWALDRSPALRDQRFDFEHPNAILHRELDRLGVPYLDLLETMRAASGEAPVYKPRDTHWNRRGNAVAAAAIHDWLVEEGW